MPRDDVRGGPRVWIVSEIYYPEMTGTGYFMTGIAEGLAETVPVSVLCSQPQYAARGTRAPTHERHNGVEIHRISGLTLDKNRLAFRLLNILSATAAMFFALIWRLGHRDLVLVVTNPPTAPYLARLAGWLRGARVVLVAHDVYPDALVAAGLISANGFSAKLMRAFSAGLLRSVDGVIACGRDMAELLRRRAGTRLDIQAIPNWAGDDLIATEETPVNACRTSLGLNERFVLQYAGNIGRVQDLPLLVEVMRQLAAAATDLRLLVIGGGARKAWLEDTIAREHLSNIVMVAEQPRDGQTDYLRACDLAVMAFVPGMFGVGVPSRLYNIMAAGRAVIAAVDAESEPGRVIAEEGIGWVVPPGDSAAFASAVREAMADRERLREMGRRARRAAIQHYQRGTILGAYSAAVSRYRAL